ncbi:hypothetical protein [Bradyrhizobium sp. BR 1433]|uniref:hypothetical protein n=1 Tax=Bradyrhizobium sp. BR 1433 TaxID=3447967 RepID=UPI003EE7FED3
MQGYISAVRSSIDDVEAVSERAGDGFEPILKRNQRRIWRNARSQVLQSIFSFQAPDQSYVPNVQSAAGPLLHLLQ